MAAASSHVEPLCSLQAKAPNKESHEITAETNHEFARSPMRNALLQNTPCENPRVLPTRNAVPSKQS